MLLLRHGILHTMSGNMDESADIIIQNGRITHVAEKADPAAFLLPDEQLEEIDLSGQHVCPGFIDLHLRHVPCVSQDDYTDRLRIASQRAGMTTALLSTPDGDPGILFHSGLARNVPPVCFLLPDRMMEDELTDRLQTASARKQLLIADIFSPAQLDKVLRCLEKAPAPLLLAHLCGCENMTQEIAQSGCGVILGACSLRRASSAYTLAAALHAAGVPVAMTTDYPSIRLHHLPLCAELCMRAGMSVEDALRVITLEPARMLGLDSELGSIEYGKIADLTIFDGPPLQLLSSVRLVICGGIPLT